MRACACARSRSGRSPDPHCSSNSEADVESSPISDIATVCSLCVRVAVRCVRGVHVCGSIGVGKGGQKRHPFALRKPPAPRLAPPPRGADAGARSPALHTATVPPAARHAGGDLPQLVAHRAHRLPLYSAPRALAPCAAPRPGLVRTPLMRCLSSAERAQGSAQASHLREGQRTPL